jgi:hypothetical protein
LEDAFLSTLFISIFKVIVIVNIEAVSGIEKEAKPSYDTDYHIEDLLSHKQALYLCLHTCSIQTNSREYPRVGHY